MRRMAKWHGQNTGIGSVPHTSVDDALDYAFAHDIPFLPQLAEERMLTLATEPTHGRAWAAFLERLPGLPLAKLQLAGPVTLKRYAQFDDLEQLKAKARFQIEALVRLGVTPLFFIDEPGLGDGPFDGLAELIAQLQRQGALTGVHCCGRTNWAALAAMPGLDVISFDASLSLEAVFTEAKDFAGTLAFGVTSLTPPVSSRSWLLTATCGLANTTASEALEVLELLRVRSAASQMSAKRDEAGAR